MIEDRIKLLEHTNNLSDKMDMLIEAFVQYYGEERRAEITQKFNSILMLKFANTDSIRKNVDDVRYGLFKDIFGLSQDAWIYFSEEFIDCLISGEVRTMYIHDDVKAAIAGTKDIETEDIIKNYLEGKYPLLEKFLNEYMAIKPRLIPYMEQVKREEQREKDINKKYFKMLVEEFSYLFTKSELDSYYKNQFANGRIYAYLSISVNTLGHCFDDEHEEKLNDPNTPSWSKESIIDDRVRFLKNFFELSGKGLEPATYEEYLENPVVVSFIKRARVECEKISKRQKELNRMKTIEIVSGLEDYLKCRSEIDKRGLVNKDDSLGPFVYLSPISCYEENFIKTPNGYVLSPLILINAGCSEHDCTIVHELNHALEQATLRVDDKSYEGINGWDKSTIAFKDHKENSQLMYTGITRDYELLSEYVNDRIAQEITDIMHSNGSYIVSPTRGKSTSSYLTVRILAEEFFIAFKEIIIKSRSNNNIGYLYECIGKENFEELNKLINEFYKTFGIAFGAMETVYNYSKGVKNENTEKLASLVERKNQIIARMREHLMNKATSTSISL